MSTLNTLFSQTAIGPYRAVVTYSNSSTGEIRVLIPSVFTDGYEASISFIGRKPYNSVWSIPTVGEQIIVIADDANLSNIFWVQVNPDPSTSLTGVQSQIDTNTNNISALTLRVSMLEANQDALFLGVFK